jgi:6-phospho-beta-galactosidase
MPLDSKLFSTSPSEDFLWGVATSGYQSEGGYNGPRQPQNNWSSSERQGSVMRTGAATEFWQRYEDDFQLCQQMGLNAFRLGLEWARIQPSLQAKPASTPTFDEEALDAYADRIAACRRYHLEPIVTLYHFTHPAWLGLDIWLSEGVIHSFIHYVRTTVTHINHRLTNYHQLSPIRWYITINEPNILVPNTYLSGQFPGASLQGTHLLQQAYNYLLTAHIQAYNAIHDLYEAEGWETPHVSLNTYCSDLYWSEKVIWDLLNLRQQNIQSGELREYLFQNAKQFNTALRGAKLPFQRDLPYRLGQWVRHLTDWMGHHFFNADYFTCYLQALESSPRPKVFDYIAIDYYDPFIAHLFRLPSFSDLEFKTKGLRSWLMSGITSKWWDWRCLPEGLHFFCQFYTQDLNSPLLIAENGIALRRKPDNSIATHRSDQIRRSEFLKVHLQQVQRLLTEGIPVKGYFHWSLTDNYEWGSYTPRFGLFTIDFAANTNRLVEDHLGDRPSETYARLIRESKRVNAKISQTQDI